MISTHSGPVTITQPSIGHAVVRCEACGYRNEVKGPDSWRYAKQGADFHRETEHPESLPAPRH